MRRAGDAAPLDGLPRGALPGEGVDDRAESHVIRLQAHGDHALVPPAAAQKPHYTALS